MLRTGIFGGSFNPIHNGHIALGRAFLEQARLDELWFVVSPQNPLKRNDNLLDDELRLEMTKLALEEEGNEKMVVSDIEFHLPKPSYMINTLTEIGKRYPDRQPVLLIGQDNWDRFDRWYKSQEIKENYEIFVYPRINCNQKITIRKSRLIQAPLYNVSSTEIRELISEGKPYRDLIPSSVADFIEAHRLYLPL